MHLRSDEQVIRVIRHHWAAIAGVILPAGFFLVALLVAKLYFNFNYFGYAWQVIGFVGLLSAIYILYQIFIWRRNGIYITNKRLVNNEQNGLFTKTVTELLYQDIHEIRYRQKGISASMNRYGTLIIKTLSDHEIVLDNIPSPEETVELINKIRISII